MQVDFNHNAMNEKKNDITKRMFFYYKQTTTAKKCISSNINI